MCRVLAGGQQSCFGAPSFWPGALGCRKDAGWRAVPEFGRVFWPGSWGLGEGGTPQWYASPHADVGAQKYIE